MLRAPILYVTLDGVLEPLAHSQVVRVVEALARRGWPYQVLSLEKPKDLEDEAKVRRLRRRLADANVRWEYEPFDWSQSSKAAVSNLSKLVGRTVELSRKGAVSGVHARGYVPGVAGFSAWLATGQPWIFDARGFWIDERLEEGRWFTTPLRLGVARGLEHQLFSTASGVVTLTELQANEVEARFPPRGARAVSCITTIADYDDFVRRPVEALDRVPLEVRRRLDGKRVVAIIGSINVSYLVDETLDLARRILARADDTHVLVLSAQRDEYQRRFSALGVPPERVTITRAEHDAMPQWLSLVDFCLLLLNPSSPAKRASMPTKLAELFAAGVRPIQYGCSAEVSEWVRRAGSGVVLEGVDARSLERAVDFVVTQKGNEGLDAARDATRAHFSLESGVDKYDRLLRSVFLERSLPQAHAK